MGVDGRVCTRWVVLRVVAEKTKMYCYLMQLKILNLNAYSVEFFNHAPTILERCQVINYPFMKQHFY